MQLDQADRGFSFLKEGPLDMRMDRSLQLTAEEIVNTWDERSLAELFREYGEEPRWRRAAKVIVECRFKHRIETTKELVDLLEKTLMQGRGKKHPATRIFQALRIAVNGELDALKSALYKVVDYLFLGGRIGVISFHSLEDRIVKHFFKKCALRTKGSQSSPSLFLLSKKPWMPEFTEIKNNPRARSAKMRCAEKI